jgi:hypothetical protein
VKIFTCTLSSILLLLLSAQTSAYYFSLDHQSFTNSNLKGVDTVAINIDPPVGLHNMEINRYGVTKTELQNQLTQRIQEAGINVVSFEEALEDPNAALIELKLRVITSYSLYYSIGLNLSVKRKAPLAAGSGGAFYSIETWSDGTVGGGSQSDLTKIYTYTSQLVDKLIVAYQDQN